MNCRKVSHLLSAYMDGELAGVESLQIRNHLNRCSECTTEYEELLGMKRLVGRLRVQQPRQELVASILQQIRIDEELRTARGPAHWFQQFAITLRTTVISPQTLGIGVGLTALALLFVAQSSSLSHNGMHADGTWDHTLPAAMDFRSGVNTSALNRFIPAARTTHWDSLQIEDLSPRANFRGNFDPSGQHPAVNTIVWHPH